MKVASIQTLWLNPKIESAADVVAQGQKLAHHWTENGCARCVVFQVSEMDMLAVLYAASCTGIDLILPAHLDNDTKDAMQVNDSDVVLNQQADVSESNQVDVQLVPNQDFSVTFFTSGSTGEPKAITRLLSRMLCEVATLEKTWGDAIDGDALFTGTVTYQHIYGFLFKLLWPLATQRKLASQGIKFEESLSQTCQSQDALVFISSPAFLKRIHQTVATEDTAMLVFSSGGLLSDDDQCHAEKLLGHEITQVYGSTETGGIAHRKYKAHWQPFDGVVCESNQNNELVVKSMHGHIDDWINTHDEVTWQGEQFILKGRTDRIVKIEEKRVSLDQVERMICAIPGVQTCRVFVMITSRQALAAVICLKNPLPESSHKAMKLEIKNALKTQVETLAIPKYIRFVNQMPINEQGKITTHALKACFQ